LTRRRARVSLAAASPLRRRSSATSAGATSRCWPSQKTGAPPALPVLCSSACVHASTCACAPASLLFSSFL
jgi:hypothetical protein